MKLANAKTSALPQFLGIVVVFVTSIVVRCGGSNPDFEQCATLSQTTPSFTTAISTSSPTVNIEPVGTVLLQHLGLSGPNVKVERTVMSDIKPV